LGGPPASGMKLRTKIAIGLSLVFLAFFIFGTSDAGQTYLKGEIPKDVTHFQYDDIVIGAGLAPFVYGLFPFLLLLGVAIGFLWSDLASSKR
jgi:hypothetical protein